MIKVVMADDQSLFRDGLKFIIEQSGDIEVVGCAGNGLEAFQLCEKYRPDLVLMDIKMPECDGVEGTKLIKAKFSNIKVIMLTTFNDDENIAQALKNGADGYLLKDSDSDELILTIKSTVKGLRVIDKGAFDAVIKKLNTENRIEEVKEVKEEKEVKENTTTVDIGLTEREISIVRLIVYGKSNKEIASSLFLSEGSTRNMISNILNKLKLKDRTQLAVFAVKNNIV